MELRMATVNDLDDLTDIACAAFDADPAWNYQYPYRRQYPEDNRSRFRDIYKRILDSEHPEKSQYRVNVVTSRSNEGDSIGKPVALAVWDLLDADVVPGEHSTPKVVPNQRKEGRDVNPDRRHAFDSAVTEARKTYFDSKYGDEQIHLTTLATHPDYQRRGAAKQHLHWGMYQATGRELAITVLASETKKDFYTHVGFERVGTKVVQVEGEEENFSFVAMVHDNFRKK